MSEADRARWERKHGSSSEAAARPTIEWIPRVERGGGLALDLACGQGRHALALLAAGYDVVGVDIARAALTRAVLRCGRSGGRFLALQADLDRWPFRPESFDVVVQIDFLDRGLFPAVKHGIRPGGLYLVDTFRAATGRSGHGPSNPDFLLRHGELERAFEGWEILESCAWSTPTPRAAILARRPSPPGSLTS